MYIYEVLLIHSQHIIQIHFGNLKKKKIIRILVLINICSYNYFKIHNTVMLCLMNALLDIWFSEDFIGFPPNV